MTGNKNSFFLSIFLGSQNKILAYNFTGSLYLWEKPTEKCTFQSDGMIVHGHFDIVTDIVWDLDGKYLLSTSKDQTTRIYSRSLKSGRWHEIGRPQVHGYDLYSIAILNSKNSNENVSKPRKISRFICSSEEKIIRMFEPTYNLIKFLNEFSGFDLIFSENHPNSFFDKKITEGTKQSLGLMTKQSEIVDDDSKFDISNFDPTAMLTNSQSQSVGYSVDFSSPPDEDFLTNHTLWPECNKLYGHSFEVYTLSASHKGDMFASANISKTEKYAKLLIWDPDLNTVVQRLDGHKLTIVQIEFSYDDSMILTVSRDQSWCLYKRVEGRKEYALYQSNKESHSRIIWSCSWSKDMSLFVTGSRDQYVKVWGKDENGKYSLRFSKDYNESVTAVEIVEVDCRRIILVGLENGDVHLERIIQKEDFSVGFRWISQTSVNISMGSKVKRLRSFINYQRRVVEVGIASEDNTVRIYSLDFEVFDM